LKLLEISKLHKIAQVQNGFRKYTLHFPFLAWPFCLQEGHRSCFIPVTQPPVPETVAQCV